MEKFEAGKSYVMPISNRCQTTLNVVSRTACYVTFTVGDGKGETRRRIEVILDADGTETECVRENGSCVTASWPW